MGSQRVGHDRGANTFTFFLFKGFPGGASGKELTYQCRSHKSGGFDPWAGKQAWKLTPGFLPGETHRQRSLASHSLWGRKELARTGRLSLHHCVMKSEFDMTTSDDQLSGWTEKKLQSTS